MRRDRAEHYRDILPQVALKCSQNERRAEEAEREVLKRKKAEYMQDHLGEAFDGHISGVTNWGVYVELDNTVEGFIHVSALPQDRYEFNADNYELVGTYTKARYQLGMPLQVRVDACDKEQGLIYLSMA
jgi:ribonuclease R